MLIRGEGLDGGISAMVVGHKETLVGDHLSGAAASEDDYGILQGRVVDTIDLLRGKPAAEILHGSGVEFLDEGEEPHSLIGHRACGYQHSRGD